MKLIVGLGNPGREYAHTRHNMGYDVIDKFADSLGVSFDKENFKGVYCKTRFLDEELFLLKPETYMNLSGECVSQFAKYFKIDNTNYYIKYNNVKRNNKDNTSINNYISNKKVNIKDKTKLYSDSNSYIELNDNIKLDLLSEKDDKYYVRFNNSIYYIYNNENVSINDNQDYIESADYVSILYFDNIEKSNS